MRQESRLNMYCTGLHVVYVFRISSVYIMFMVTVTKKNTGTYAKWRLFIVMFVYHRLLICRQAVMFTVMGIIQLNTT